MIVDSSAVVAIVFREPDHEVLVDQLLASDVVGIGAPTAAETAVVLTARLGPKGAGLLSRFLREFLVEVIPFSDAHWREAAEAYLRFGRARHPAGLNFGDCLTYATCRLADRPLLYVGDDFGQTDLDRA